MTTTRSWASK